MLLRRLDVENFRGLRQATLQFDATTALIGENGAGKTTMLDAIAICLGGRGDDVRLEARDFHRLDGTAAAETLRISLTFEEPAGEGSRAGWAPFVPFTTTAGGPRQLQLHVTGRRDPKTGLVSSSWTFGGDDQGAGDGPSCAPGLLSALRRVSPVLRIRANRYVESDPRGEAPEARARGQGASDPVASHLEQQVRLLYDRLTGTSEVLDDELRQGVEAAEALLASNPRFSGAAVTSQPRVRGDLAETPLRAGNIKGSLLSGVKQGAGARGLALVAIIGVLLEARKRIEIAEGARPLVVLEDAEAHLHPLMLSAMWDLVAALPAQKILTTNSGELLASVPLRSLRRLVRTRTGTRVYQVETDRYGLDDLRRIAYHVRVNRAGALFARCWLLVEGETEAWLLPELAQVSGVSFPSEGIRCVEFAQCGVRPLLRLANDLGIEWHLLADGDEAGQSYATTAARYRGNRALTDRITRLEEPDIEHCLFFNGYEDVYQSAAGPAPPGSRARGRERASRVIDRAIHKRSKPGLALAIVESANQPGAAPIPEALRRLVETVVRLARAS
jgi:putative ATP-dependent endonuclease of OLD family